MDSEVSAIKRRVTPKSVKKQFIFKSSDSDLSYKKEFIVKNFANTLIVN